MSAQPPSDESLRPRPLAELGLEALVARTDELAKEWAIALIAVRPLQSVAEIPLADLAQQAPALIAQAIRALGSDRELDRLLASAPSSGRDQPGAARALAAMSGAAGAPALVRAVEALRSVLWQRLLVDLHSQRRGGAEMRQLSDLSERLSFICAQMLAVALEDEPVLPRALTIQSPGSSRGSSSPREDVIRAGAMLVDERVESTPASSSEAERPASWDASPPRGTQRRSERASVWQEPAGAHPGSDEIAIHDARGEEGPAAWIGLISRQLQLSREDGRPFAVLLVEPRETETMGGGEPRAEQLRLSEELEDALALAFGAAPPGEPATRSPGRGSLTRERAGRYWLLAPETDRSGASALADRLARAVASVVEHRGQPLEVLIGTAACPEDGGTAAALAAHADVSLYAARSAARTARAPRTALRED